MSDLYPSRAAGCLPRWGGARPPPCRLSKAGPLSPNQRTISPSTRRDHVLGQNKTIVITRTYADMKYPIALALLIVTAASAVAGQSPEQMRREVEEGFAKMKAQDGAKSREMPIPRSMPGDMGKYFLLEATRKGSVVYAVSKRVGVDSTTYSRTETNCDTRQMREIGVSEVSREAIKERPTKWFDLVPGSSKADLAAFVCR